MQYESYERRIVKVANFLKWIFKHRLKIIISLSFVMAATAALLATRGYVISESDCPSSVVYGEELDYSANAFLSEVYYEYASDEDGEWSTEFPIHPGDYYVRAVANATFGKRYGDAQSFALLPKPITVRIVDNRVIYGDNPLVGADLVVGDVLECNRFTYDSNAKTAEADVDGITVTNINGIDVTRSYTITTEAREIITSPRPVTIAAKSYDKVYDGAPLIADGYDILVGSLAPGDRLDAVIEGSITNVGSVASTIRCTVSNENGDDVSLFYNITTVSGIIRVTPREITLASESYTAVYDGADHMINVGSVAYGALVNGDRVVYSGWEEFNDVVDTKNTFVGAVLNSQNVDVTDNYSISYEYGAVSISRRPVIITTESKQTTYDGYGQEWPEYSISGGMELISGHKYETTLWINPVDAGEYENSCSLIITDRSSGADVSSNYDITYTFGYIDVAKRNIVIDTLSDSFMYTGQQIGYNFWEVSSGSVAAPDELLVLSYATERNVGTYINEIDFTIVRDGSDTDVSHNYNMSVNYGSFSITKRPITVASATDTFVYNGEEQYNSALIITGEYDLGYGDYFDVLSYTTVKNVVSNQANNVTFNIKSDEYGNATDNYTVDYTSGTLTVTKRDVWVTMSSADKRYNGTAQSSPEHDVSGLVTGHRFELISSTAATAVGEYINEVIDYDILDENDNSVKSNYNFNQIKGVLAIMSRPVIVTTGSATKVYDATPLTSTEWVISDESLYYLSENHVIDAPVPNGTITDVGTVINTYSGVVRIRDEYGNDVTSNYELYVREGQLTVTPRPITVSNKGIDKNVSFVYDGKNHVYNEVEVTGNPLCTGHYIEVTDYSTHKNVVTDAYASIDFVIRDGSYRSVTGNYEITYDWSTITITPRPITVVNGGIGSTVSFVYDGKAHTYSNVVVSAGSLCEYHSIYVTDPAVFKNVVTNEDIEIDFEIRDEYNGNVIDNYDITEIWSKITITPRPITVVNGGIGSTVSFVYDGKEHTYSSIAVSAGSLCQYHSIYVTDPAVFKDVVTNADIEIDFEIHDEYNEDVTANYEITRNWSKITITPRPITVVNGGIGSTVSFVYDGKEHTYGSVAVSAGSLCEYHSIFVTDPAVFKNVVTDAEIDIGFEIHDEYNEDVTYNYDITEDWSTITITKRPITVVNGGIGSTVSFVYDGKEHEYSNIAVSAGTLCDYHYIFVTAPAVFKDVVTDGEIAIDFEIRDEYNEDVTANYEITRNWSKITITPRPITVINAGLEKTVTLIYDGQNHAYSAVGVSLGSLCNQHYFDVTNPATFKNVVTDATMAIGFDIRDEYGIIVTHNYDITEDWSSITILPRPITVTTESYVGDYDGSDHNINDVYVTDGELCYGHYIVSEDSIYRDAVTDCPNDVRFDIFDELGERVTDNYEITKILGTVTINKRLVKLYTESKSWYYDGEAHSHPVYKVYVEYDVVEGHRIIIVSFAEITDIGQVDNILVFKITDGDLDVTNNYTIEHDPCGVLTVLPPDTPDDPIIDSPPDDYVIGLPEPGDDEPGDDDAEAIVIFIVNSDTNGQVYLKQNSYGTYTGNGFTKAPVYEYNFMDQLSAYYLASKAGENGGVVVSSMEITSLHGLYALPYYSLEYGTVPQSSDTVVSGYAGAPYTVYYVASLEGAILPESLTSFEELYSAFVHSTYLQTDAETDAYFQQIITEQGFSASDPDIIAKVASYIQNAATYDLRYDRSLDSSDNIAVEFLRTYKSGVCQHYATAATMLYRSLGIPARYTVGYTSYAVAGQNVEVTSNQAHAWVEVYIDGIGWMQVEVTGSDSGFDGPGVPDDGEDFDEFLGDIVVKPKKQIKVYDSTPLYAKNEIIESGLLAELVERGCSYKVEVVGAQTDVGIGTSEVKSFTLFDPQGNDITHLVNVTYQPGILEIVAGIIDIYIHEKNFVYDATEKGYLNSEYLVIDIPDGVQIVVNSINISGTDTVLLNSDQITDKIYDYIDFSVYKDGVLQDSGSYAVRVVGLDGESRYNIFSISKRDITVTTGSANKPYDGEPLENPTFYIPIGMLGEGHTLHLDVLGTITEVGEVENTIDRESLSITDAYGNDVTKNYNVKCILGTLKIT